MRLSARTAAPIALLVLVGTAIAAGWGRGGEECARLAGRAAEAAAEARETARGAGSAAAEAGRRLGVELGETKEQLKLGYDVQAQDNGGNRVSVTFTLADEGRITPITQVKVAVPSADKSGYYDVVAVLAPFEKDGKKVYMLQLTRDLVERGEIDLVTSTIDGKRMIEWGYHRVVLAPALKAFDEKAKLSKLKELEAGGQAPGTAAPGGRPATDRKP